MVPTPPTGKRISRITARYLAITFVAVRRLTSPTPGRFDRRYPLGIRERLQRRWRSSLLEHGQRKLPIYCKLGRSSRRKQY